MFSKKEISGNRNFENSGKFLLSNYDDLTSTRLAIFHPDKSHKPTFLNWNDYSRNLRKWSNAKIDEVVAISCADSTTVSNNLLIKNILNAWGTRERYGWSKNIPDDIFYEYLLPYKVLNEDSQDWRDFFIKKYQAVLDSFSRLNVKDARLIYRFIIDDTKTWYRYSERQMKLNIPPNLDELVTLREGDCNRFAYLYTFALRSCGIPATIDVVPAWGSKNGGHVEAVYWRGAKMTTFDEGRLSHSAKVFRASFKKQLIDSSSSMIPGELIPRTHWLDVTSEHNITYDVRIANLQAFAHLVASIYIYNYGQWEIVSQCRVQADGVAVFPKMGSDILYRIGFQKDETSRFWGVPFLLTKKGEQAPITPGKILMEVNCRMQNTGGRSWIKKNQEYKLSVLSSKGDWKVLAKRRALKDSLVVFQNVPCAGFYKITSTGFEHLARPFQYNNEQQIWY